MSVTATWRNGTIVPDGAVDWPEGCRLVVEPAELVAAVGMREEDWPTTPEGIAKHLALMDAIEPYLPTDQEFAEWESALHERKELEQKRN